MYTIKEPIWAGRKVGLNLDECHDKILTVEITYKRKTDKTRLYPNKFWIYRSIAERFPKQRLKGGVTVHLVPIAALHEKEEEEIEQNEAERETLDLS